MSTRRHVLVFRELPGDQLARLQAAHQVTIANPRAPGERDAFFAALPQAEALIGSSYPVTDALLDSGSETVEDKLKALAELDFRQGKLCA